MIVFTPTAPKTAPFLVSAEVLANHRLVAIHNPFDIAPPQDSREEYSVWLSSVLRQIVPSLKIRSSYGTF